MNNLLKRLAMILAALQMFGCSRPAEATPVPVSPVKGEELYCLVDSQEEAEKIAESYDIVLVKFGHGVATFTTDKDLHEVIQYGKKNNLAPISINTATIQTYN